MTDVTFPLFPILSCLGFVLSLIPLPWHLQAWNSGTCYFMVWSALACLNKFINSLIWAHNASDSAPAFCEISTRITIGASVGIPAASLCINRRLYKIARVHAVMVTRSEKRKAILFDTFLCAVLPIICMILAYIVQGHRYNVFEQVGCYPAIYNTIPAYFLVYMWPIVIGCISAVYCCMSLRALIARQAQFNQFLTSGTSLTMSRYFRLMALALTDLVLTVPFGIYEVYSNTAGQPVAPWVSWADTHFNFSRVDQYPAYLWRAVPYIAIPMELSRWIVPATAFIFFAYFGFAEEARRQYRAAFIAIHSQFWKVFRRFHKKPTSSIPISTQPEFLPPYTPSSATTLWSKPSDVQGYPKTKLDDIVYDISSKNEKSPQSPTTSSSMSSCVTYSSDDVGHAV